MKLLLVRHAESQANAGLSDDIDCGLTELGRQQAATLAATLERFAATRLLCTPYRRSLDTARIIRQRIAVPAEIYPAMHEHHGEPFPHGWPFQTRSQLRANYEEFALPPETGEKGFVAAPEDRLGQWKRVNRVLRELLARFDGRQDERVILVAHQAPISAFIQAFCNWTNPLDVAVHMDNAAITLLETDPAGRRHLVLHNWRPGLEY